MVGIDLETTGLNPRTDRVRLISLSTAEGSWLIDCFEVDPHPLFEVLGQKLVMHNGQFDLVYCPRWASRLRKAQRSSTRCCYPNTGKRGHEP